MTSLQRKLRRKKWGAKAFKERFSKPQPFISQPDGGYKTLRPTKGWIKVAGIRLKLQPLLHYLKTGGK